MFVCKKTAVLFWVAAFFNYLSSSAQINVFLFYFICEAAHPNIEYSNKKNIKTQKAKTKMSKKVILVGKSWELSAETNFDHQIKSAVAQFFPQWQSFASFHLASFKITKKKREFIGVCNIDYYFWIIIIKAKFASLDSDDDGDGEEWAFEWERERESKGHERAQFRWWHWTPQRLIIVWEKGEGEFMKSRNLIAIFVVDVVLDRNWKWQQQQRQQLTISCH